MGQNTDLDPTSESLRDRLEDLFRLMLLIWIKERKAVNALSPVPDECDKTVTVYRQSGQFGFRIHGSRPVVVSAIEPGTPAESSGLEVGDIIMTINGISVLDATHSEVVKIAHAGSETLELEVARTCNILTPIVSNPAASEPLYAGYLWKLGGGGSAIVKKWYRRWFCLKQDNCLYYYKDEGECQPLGAIMLLNYTVSKSPDQSKPFAFKVFKYGSATQHLAAETEEAMNRWASVINHASTTAGKVDMWLELSNRNIQLPAMNIQQPDCFGYLTKLGNKWKTWKRRYCILKDACLYFYQEGNASTALGVAHLHGYRVQSCSFGGKKHAFETVPPEPKFRHFYFYTDSETDKKRWLAALEYSIDRWIKVG